MQIDSSIPEVARRQIEHIAEVCERIKPLVVIGCITYNHEAFLRDALEGFVMQKTNFPFVAVVHDDASTDGTAAVLREYAERYPDIILPIYEEENQYSKRNGTLGLINRASRAATGAKYVALCEGDDYWTSPDKLQRQVDFLEANPEYSLVFHNATEHWEDGSYPDKNVVTLSEGDVTPMQLYASYHVPTTSILFKRDVLSSDIYLQSINCLSKQAFGDIQITIASGFSGKIYYMDQCMAIYRKLASGASTAIADRPLQHIRTRIAMSSKVYGPEYIKIDKKYAASCLIPALKHPFKHFPDNLVLIYEILRFAPIESLKQTKWIVRSIKHKINNIMHI